MKENSMPTRNCCLDCRCLVADYCYGAYFNRNPEKTDCPDYEPVTEPGSIIAEIFEKNIVPAIRKMEK